MAEGGSRTKEEGLIPLNMGSSAPVAVTPSPFWLPEHDTTKHQHQHHPPPPPPPNLYSSLTDLIGDTRMHPDHPHPHENRTLNVKDALEYLDAVKNQFTNSPDVYNVFLDIMKDFKSNTIETPGVIQRVSKLFHGNTRLIQGFNTFLPPGYRIDVSADPTDNTIIVTTPSGIMTHATGSATINRANNYHVDPAMAFALNSMNEQPAVLNNAIHFLSKVKSRYESSPNIYKEFLDILQAYQKEQKQDPSVFPQVQMLFKDAPELIVEFKAFLPEFGTAQQPVWSPPSPQPKNKIMPSSKRAKKRPLEKEPTPQPVSGRTKKVKHHHHSPPFSPYAPPRSPPPQVYHPHGKLVVIDRIKKALESRDTYTEFLSLLNLYNQEIIDMDTLIENAKVYVVEEDLMAEFKQLWARDEREEEMIENGPPGSIRTAAPEVPQPVDDGEGPSYRRLPDAEIRLACSGRDELCRSVLNDEWVSHPTWASEESGFVAHKKNSFEEALHKSEEERHEYHVHIEALTRTIAVLEPLCARIEEMPPEERAGFKVHADFGGSGKTIYHRTIKRVYGRDSGLEIIQALQDCPSVAVPVVLARLKQRDEEYKRAQRDWSRTWREVDSKNFYKSLDHQGISFKQNDKKNITAKHFCTDIDNIRRTQLEQELFEITNSGKPSWKMSIQGSVGHQLEFAFNDTSVLLDSLKMIYSFLDRSQAQYSPVERRAVDKFLRAFIPCLFNYPGLELGSVVGSGEGVSQQTSSGAAEQQEAAAVHEIMMLNGGHTDGQRSGKRSNGGTPNAGHSSGVPANDLRKKLLKTAQEKASGSKRDKEGAGNSSAAAATGGTTTRGANSAAGSRAGTPHPESRFAQTDENGRVIPDVWMEAEHSNDAGVPDTSDLERPFFANTTFYTLLRLLQLLYSRLLMSKEIGAGLAAQKHASLTANQIAVDLGLVDPHGPPVVLQQTIDAMGERGTAPGANAIYAYLLNACERLFDGEMDQPTFEEHMRWFFGTRAYHLFTIDKLITALIKQVQSILSDHKSQELWTLLQTAQGVEKLTKQDVIRYRRSAEQHIGPGHDDHLFRIQWIREKKCIRMSLMAQEDATVPTDGGGVSRWREYLNTYVMSYPTEWLPSTKPTSGPVFLRRNLQNEESTASTSSLVRDERTKIRMMLPSYKLVYENGCEDFIWRNWTAEEGAVLRERARARSDDRRRCRMLSS